MTDKIEELRETVEQYTAEEGTGAAEEAIYADSTHTSVIWDDGEISFRKNGDLWGMRSWHQSSGPFLKDGTLWSMNGGKHSYRVVTDSDGLKEALREWKEKYCETRVATFTLQFTHQDSPDDETADERTEILLETMTKGQLIANLMRTIEVNTLES